MIGIIGGGSWATAIAKILLASGHQSVNWWVRSQSTRDSIATSGHNPNHLSSATLDPSRLVVSTDLAAVVNLSSHLFLAIPSAYIHTVLNQLPHHALLDKKIISAVKGSIPDCCMSVSTYLNRHLLVPNDHICILSGPSHAEEVGADLPTFLTVASSNLSLAAEVQQLLRCHYIHTSLSADTDGIERCGLAKNIYAIAAGICQGLGYGDNLQAVLTAAAARELSHTLDKHYPLPDRDFNRPCYLGDLTVTCWSPHSRNRALGQAVASGKSPQEVFAATGSIAEGYFNVKNLHQIVSSTNHLDEVPIAEAVYRILYLHSDPKSEMDLLIDTVF